MFPPSHHAPSCTTSPAFPPAAAGLDPYNAETALAAATEIVSFTGSFHGRTMGSLALTYKDQYKTPFQPVGGWVGAVGGVVS